MIKKGLINNFIMQFIHHLLLDADKSIMICVSTKAWPTSIAVLMVIISSFSGIKFVHDGCHCLDH
jgi:hypothetical protein